MSLNNRLEVFTDFITDIGTKGIVSVTSGAYDVQKGRNRFRLDCTGKAMDSPGQALRVPGG
jgi:hypothetical protein